MKAKVSSAKPYKAFLYCSTTLLSSSAQMKAEVGSAKPYNVNRTVLLESDTQLQHHTSPYIEIELQKGKPLPSHSYLLHSWASSTLHSSSYYASLRFRRTVLRILSATSAPSQIWSYMLQPISPRMDNTPD